MEFTKFEKEWIKELIQEEYAKQKEQQIFEADEEAFKSILEKIDKENN